MKNVKIGQLPALLDLLRFGSSEHDTGLENERGHEPRVKLPEHPDRDTRRTAAVLSGTERR